jgi:hypothetical protein
MAAINATQSIATTRNHWGWAEAIRPRWSLVVKIFL